MNKYPLPEGVSTDVLVWTGELNEHLEAAVQHFNQLQIRYRILASTWLLATLTAIGFVMTRDLGVAFPQEWLEISLALAGSIGIFVLWVIDLLVYHVMLVAYHEMGKKLEDRCPWLPPARNALGAMLIGPAVRVLVLIFYLAGTALLISVALLLSFHLDEPGRGATTFKGLSPVVGAILFLVMIGGIWLSLRNKNEVVERIAQQWTLFKNDDSAES